MIPQSSHRIPGKHLHPKLIVVVSTLSILTLTIILIIILLMSPFRTIRRGRHEPVGAVELGSVDPLDRHASSFRERFRAPHFLHARDRADQSFPHLQHGGDIPRNVWPPHPGVRPFASRSTLRIRTSIDELPLGKKDSLATVSPDSSFTLTPPTSAEPCKETSISPSNDTNVKVRFNDYTLDDKANGSQNVKDHKKNRFLDKILTRSNGADRDPMSPENLAKHYPFLYEQMKKQQQEPKKASTVNNGPTDGAMDSPTKSGEAIPLRQPPPSWLHRRHSSAALKSSDDPVVHPPKKCNLLPREAGCVRAPTVEMLNASLLRDCHPERPRQHPTPRGVGGHGLHLDAPKKGLPPLPSLPLPPIPGTNNDCSTSEIVRLYERNGSAGDLSLSGISGHAAPGASAARFTRVNEESHRRLQETDFANLSLPVPVPLPLRTSRSHPSLYHHGYHVHSAEQYQPHPSQAPHLPDEEEEEDFEDAQLDALLDDDTKTITTTATDGDTHGSADTEPAPTSDNRLSTLSALSLSNFPVPPTHAPHSVPAKGSVQGQAQGLHQPVPRRGKGLVTEEDDKYPWTMNLTPITMTPSPGSSRVDLGLDLGCADAQGSEEFLVEGVRL